MDFLWRWEAWLIVILFVLVIIWIYMKVSDVTLTQTVTNTSTQTDTHTNDQPVVSSLTTGDHTLTREEAEEHDSTVDEYRAYAIMPRPEDNVANTNIIDTAQSVGERECMKVFKEFYGSSVQAHVRSLNWLTNPLTGRRLELDMFAPNAMVACEYDGEQHSKVVPKFHPYGERSLEYQKWKDRFKDAACKENGVHLIRVPHTVQLKSIRQYIIDRLPQ